MTVTPYEPQPGINPSTDSWTAVLADVGKLANIISATEFVPNGLRGSAPKVAAAMLYGRELGLPPMTSLAGIQVIQGKPGLSAEMMRALILAAGHQLRIKQAEGTCTIRARRREDIGDDEAWQEFTFTRAQAQKAGLKSEGWIKYEADMLLARATSRAARAMFADVTHGLHAVEELTDEPTQTVSVTVAAPAHLKQIDPEEKPLQLDPPPPIKLEPEAKSQPEVEPQAEVESPAPQATTPESVAEVLDAEVVETKRSEKVTRAQLKLLAVEFDRLGITEREEKHKAASEILGRELASANDMSIDEAGMVIDALKSLDPRDVAQPDDSQDELA